MGWKSLRRKLKKWKPLKSFQKLLPYVGVVLPMLGSLGYLSAGQVSSYGRFFDKASQYQDVYKMYAGGRKRKAGEALLTLAAGKRQAKEAIRQFDGLMPASGAVARKILRKFRRLEKEASKRPGVHV